MLTAFIYGALLSLGLIIPLGMQNLFVFNQGLTQRHFWAALPAVLTAFICDLILILCAVLGLSLLVLTLPWMKILILGLGSCFLLLMGWKLWRTEVELVEEAKPLSTLSQIAFAVSVSIFNPHALIDTVSVIGTNSLNFSGQEKWAYTAACLSVSFCWFLFLSLAGHFFKKLDKNGRGTKVFNQFSAVVLSMTAIYLAVQFFSSLSWLGF